MQRCIDERTYGALSTISPQPHPDLSSLFLHWIKSVSHPMQRGYISSTTDQDCVNRFWREQSEEIKLRVVKLRLHERRAVCMRGEVLSPAAGDGQGLLPVLDGSQPSRRIMRRFRCKRKVKPIDCEQNPRPTKKVASDTAVLKDVELFLAPPKPSVRDRWHVCRLCGVRRRESQLVAVGPRPRKFHCSAAFPCLP